MMRKRPIFLFWLLILILIYNGAVLLVTRTKVLNSYINKYAVSYLKKQMNADLQIGDLTLSDKQVIINDVNIVNKADDYIFNLEQLIVDYKLLGFLPGINKNYRPFNEITIVNPELIITYTLPDSSSSSQTQFEIPNLGKFFSQLTIIDGSVKYTVISPAEGSHELYLNDTINHIDASVTAWNNDFEMILNANSKKGSSLSSFLKVQDLKLTKLNATISDLIPAEVSTKYFEELDFEADIVVNYINEQDSTDVNIEARFEDLFIKYHENKLYAPDLIASLTGDNLYVRTDLVNLDEMTGRATFTIQEPFNGDPGLSGTVNVDTFNPVVLLDELGGAVDGHFILSGKVTSPEVYGVVEVDSLKWEDYKLTDGLLKLDYVENKLGLIIEESNIKDNIVTGEIEVNHFNDLNITLTSIPEEGNNDLSLEGTVSGNIVIDPQLTGSFDLSNAGFSNNTIDLNKVNAEILLTGDSLAVKSNIGTNVDIECSYNISKKKGYADVELNGVKGEDVLKNALGKPLDTMELFGRTTVSLNGDLIDCNASFRVEESETLTLDSRLIIEFNYNLDEKLGSFKAETGSSLLNKREFSYKIDTSIQDNTLWVNHFDLNSQINGDGWVTLGDSLDYGVTVSGKSIGVRDILRYFTNDYQARQFDGYVDMDLDLNSKGDNRTLGMIDVRNFSYGIFKPIGTTLKLNGNSKHIELSNSFKNEGIKNAVDINGFIDISNRPILTINGDVDGLFLSQVFDENLNGILDGSAKLYFGKESTIPTLSVKATSKNLQVYGFDISSLNADLKQFDSKLVVDSLMIESDNTVSLLANGAIGYNIFTDANIAGTDSLNISIDADLASVLKRFRLADKGEAKTSINLVTSMDEDGLNFHSGQIHLKNGKMNVETQLQQLEDITLDIVINDNEMMINDFKVKSGDGSVYIRNEVIGDEKDLTLGNMKIGKLFITTDDEGIKLTVPEYSQENTLTNAIIKGRHGREATITGPFDDLYIESDVIIRNAMGLYPPKVDNLLKLFSQLNPIGSNRNSTSEVALLPFQLDTVLYFDDNSRYITHPANIPVRENSFIHLFYNREEWIVKKILLIADTGTFDFFGINFKVDYFEVGINEFSGEYLLGELYHKTSDGTTILLTIDTDDDLSKEFVNRLQFNISSDNPNDRSIVNMLARVRYDSELSDLSDEQESSIWQDEALNLLDGNLNSYYLDPILYPFENYVRKFLRLDFLYVDFGFLQNVYFNYIINEENEIKREESQLVEFSSAILLDNLKINAGKYLTRNVYFDYTALFQETTDLETETNILINHDATFRLSLPQKFKVSYSFGIEPDKDEMYSHEVMLQRTFRFDFNNYKYNKNRR